LVISDSGERVSNAWVTFLEVRDSSSKDGIILDSLVYREVFPVKNFASRLAHVLSASWWCNGLPRLRRIAGVRARSATVELRHGPHSYGRQQLGILHNGGNPDVATPRGGRRFSDRKLLLYGKNK
jgi:hypothetical protein